MDFLFSALGVPHGDFWLTALEIRAWGQTLWLLGQYRGGETLDFTLTFTGCREMKWRIYSHAEPRAETLIADFAPGRDDHRSPAHLLTDAFGVSLYYGALEIRREDADGRDL